MGYLPFDCFIYTNHRDKKPKCVSKHVKTAHKYLEENNFFPLLHKSNKTTDSDHALAERLDKIFMQACLLAKKSVKDNGLTGGLSQSSEPGRQYIY
eukprot:2065145-Ditylum_brightwellii.AAC.1